MDFAFRRRIGRVFLMSAVLLVFASIAGMRAEAASLDLSAYRGKVVYLDFWASWCTPCRQSFPWMNAIQDEYRGRGLVVIAVNLDHAHHLATDFLSQNPADFKIVYDPDGNLASRYHVAAMPTSVLIGRDGKIRYVHAGFYPGKERDYLAHIAALLNQKAS